MICGYEVATDFIAYPTFHATIENNLRFRVDCQSRFSNDPDLVLKQAEIHFKEATDFCEKAVDAGSQKAKTVLTSLQKSLLDIQQFLYTGEYNAVEADPKPVIKRADTHYRLALELWEIAAQMGDADAEKKLRWMNAAEAKSGHNGSNAHNKRNVTENIGALSEEINSETADAFYKKAIDCLFSENVEERKGAVPLLIKAVEVGSEHSMILLGKCYKTGWSVGQAVAELSTPTSMNYLYSKLAGSLNAIMGSLAVCLTEITEQKGGAAEAVAGKAEFDVVMTSFGAKKIKVIKEIRGITGLGLLTANAMVEKVPITVKEGVSKEDAKALKAQLEAVGASVEVKQVTTSLE